MSYNNNIKHLEYKHKRSEQRFAVERSYFVRQYLQLEIIFKEIIR